MRRFFRTSGTIFSALIQRRLLQTIGAACSGRGERLLTASLYGKMPRTYITRRVIYVRGFVFSASFYCSAIKTLISLARVSPLRPTAAHAIKNSLRLFLLLRNKNSRFHSRASRPCGQPTRMRIKNSLRLFLLLRNKNSRFHSRASRPDGQPPRMRIKNSLRLFFIAHCTATDRPSSTASSAPGYPRSATARRISCARCSGT